MKKHFAKWSYSLDVHFVIEAEDKDKAAELVENMDMAEVSDLGFGNPGGGLYFGITEIDNDADIQKLRHQARK